MTRRWAVYFLYGLLVVALGYGSLIGARFGIFDVNLYVFDYGWLGKSHATEVMLGAGRWFLNWISVLTFPMVHSLYDLGIFRIFSLILLTVFGAIWLAHSERRGWSIWWSIPALILILVNPGVAVYAFWSVCYPYGLAMILGLLAAFLWDRRKWWGFLSGTIILQVALATYQPGAVLFLLPAILLNPGSTGDPSTASFRISDWLSDRRVGLLAGFGIGMGLHFISFRLITRFFLDGKGQAHRLLEDASPMAFIRTFFTDLFPIGFTSWGELLYGSFWLVFPVFLGFGVVLYLIGRMAQANGWSGRIREAACFVGLLAGSYLPAAIAVKGFAFFRVVAPVYSVIGLMAVAGFRLAAQRWPKLQQWALAAMIGFVLLNLFAANRVIREGVIKPRKAEMTAIESWFGQYDELPEGVTIILPDGWLEISSMVPRLGEYGYYELTDPGFMKYFVILIALETFAMEPEDFQGQNPFDVFDVMAFPARQRKIPPMYPVMDLPLLLHGEDLGATKWSPGVERIHDRLGRATFYEPNFWSSPWFGEFREEGIWVRHRELGWFCWISPPGAKEVVIYKINGEVRSLTVPD
ncbi:MAG TPA: hypothetical protein VK995_01365 [Oceanipulchritudo sp.]|nr:hypothetical protein [Oceanipulchritudo sp.]